MKKTSLLKILVVFVLSLILVVSLGKVVLGADNDPFDWDAPSIEGNNSSTGNNSATGNNSSTGNSSTAGNTSNNSFGSSVVENEQNNTDISTNSGTLTTNLNTSDDNNNVNNNSNVNSLAYTGIEDNSVLAIVIVLGVIVAAYSFKKVKDYNSL